MSVDGGDQGFRKVFDFAEGGLAAAGHLRDSLQGRGILSIEAAVTSHRLDIGTGHEIAIDRAGQDDHARSVVLLQPPQRLDEFLL